MNHICSSFCTYLLLQDTEEEVARYLQSFHEVLVLRRWRRQLFMRRVAALWMYTEFFMITGILASSSALRMHSSKNPEERTPLWAMNDTASKEPDKRDCTCSPSCRLSQVMAQVMAQVKHLPISSQTKIYEAPEHHQVQNNRNLQCHNSN